VKEYWIVNPKLLRVYINEDGKFKLLSEVKDRGKIKSKIIENLEIHLQNIFP